MVTLWHLLLVLAPSAALGGATVCARNANAGATGWVVAGVVVGLSAYATFRLNRLAEPYARRLLAEPDHAGAEGRFRMLYGLAIGWVICNGPLAFGLTHTLLDIVEA